MVRQETADNVRDGEGKVWLERHGHREPQNEIEPEPRVAKPQRFWIVFFSGF